MGFIPVASGLLAGMSRQAAADFEGDVNLLWEKSGITTIDVQWEEGLVLLSGAPHALVCTRSELVQILHFYFPSESNTRAIPPSQAGGGRGGSGGSERDRIQKLVDKRQECRRVREFDRADSIRNDLRDMGVTVDDTNLTWWGHDGHEGTVKILKNGSRGGGGGIQRRNGDWDCPQCGALIFASKDDCFRCRYKKDC